MHNREGQAVHYRALGKYACTNSVFGVREIVSQMPGHV